MGKNLSAWLIGLSGVMGAGYWTLLSPHSQIMGSFPYRGNRSDQVIALTFDDGPNEPFTTQIGEFLASKAIRATFFQVGRCVERFPEATERLIQQGHIIGNHSYSHEAMKCLAPRLQRQQTEATQQILQRVIGRSPALYRPPWLLRTPALQATLRSHGLRPISGDFCHPLEVFQVSPLRIARRALAKAGPGAILIFHDGFNSHQADRSKTVQAVKIVVARLIRQGYLFVTVDELLDIPAYQDPAPAHQHGGLSARRLTVSHSQFGRRAGPPSGIRW